MESGENYRLSGVNFSTSPNVWRVSGGASEYFSKSSFEEVVDDEEALKWASIERLPTSTRLRRSVLTEDGGGIVREVDVKHLGHAERRNVLERLVQFDNEKFLLKFKDRIQRVGVTVPTVEVRFENLSVKAEAYVGGRALPTLGNFVVNIFESLLTSIHVIPSRKTLFAILNDVSGLLKPGRMALLLGPPGSGKTTLLKALAGELDKDLQRTSSYISQHDLHIGELTVRETLAFSARCQGVGSCHDGIDAGLSLRSLGSSPNHASL